jgi:hypothetical protein
MKFLSVSVSGFKLMKETPVSAFYLYFAKTGVWMVNQKGSLQVGNR